eukprot:TRINITY_DN7150_c0_g1_i1.p1 TRINITY_DN7150_c0_g1~~TRINITY_DN7150_c0_g1_i1.p1  ORF type:complete len:399 (+),score=122.42 TRINITY_DN7150_c0_g1_i1:1246-2442(+)
MDYFFQLPFPSYWDLKRELGLKFLGMGIAASALQTFEELELWDEVIQCYQVMDKPKKAEEIVRRQLEVAPTPLLYCILGDLTNDEKRYYEAWEFSKHTFARAQRSLARGCLAREEYAECLSHFEAALAINPLFHSAWFTAGCAAMKIQQWDKAINAFARCVQIEPEEAEAWNNMASCYIQQRKKREAFRALQEGLRHMRNNWRIWQNFMFVSVDLGEFQYAMNAMVEILNLKDDNEVDIEVVAMMCKVVTENIVDCHDRPGSELKPTLEKMLEVIASKISSNPALWKVYSKYYADLGDTPKAIEYAEKGYRASQKAGWENSQQFFDLFAQGTIDLVKTHMAAGSDLYSSKQKLRSLLKKAEDNFGNSEMYKNLQLVSDEVNAKEKEAASSNRIENDFI